MAIGDSALAQGGKAVSIGAGNTATGNGAVAIGDPNAATGTGAVAMGADNTANGQGAVALGNTNTATGQGSVALGNTSNAAAAGAVALGDTAVANNTNDVALGSKSTTAAPHTGTTAQFGGIAAGVEAAASTNGVVSVGAAGTERQIQNVAAGVISATSTDAINGSQLNSVVTGVNNVGTTTASTLGGGATYSPATGNITGFSQPINSISATGAVTGPTAQANVASALTALNTNVNNTANIAVKYDAAGGNRITLGATGGAGAGAPVTITNLAPAALNGTSTDAVNGSQLFATNTTVNNINNGAGIKYFHANSTLADSTAIGTDSVAVGPTASSTATNAVALGNGATAGSANSVALGSGSSATGTTLGNAAYSVGGAATGGEVNIANGADGRRITGLAAGSSATDAVNVSQLNKAGQDTATALGGGAALDANTGAWTAPSYSTNSISATGANTGPLVSGDVGTALTNLNTSVTNTAAVAVKYDDASTKTQVTFNPAGTAVKLTNVAAGALNASSTDAVNGSQLFATNQTVDNVVNNGAGIKYFHSNSVLADSSATGLDSVAIGPAASSTVANGVALGSNSSATGATLGNAAYGVGGAATGGEVNIANGADGRRITGLAAGSSATDAVNVGQLNKAGQDTATALGGGAALDATTGVWTAPSYSTNSISATGANSGPLVSNNVGTALSNLNTSLTNTAAVAVKYDDAATKDQVTFNPAGTSVKLTNVAAGALNSTSTDAVNGSQLFASSQNTASALGGGAAVNATTGAWTAPSYSTNSISATGANTGPLVSSDVGAALSNLNTSVTNTAAVAVKYDDAATKDQVTFNPAGAAVKLTNVAAGTLNATSTDAVNGSQLFATNQIVNSINNGAGIKYFHANSTLADSSATGQDSVAIGPLASATIANGVALGSNSSATGTTLANAAYGVGGAATAGGEVNIANGANGRRITGLAAGSSATDAVNVSQLNKAGQDTATALGGGAVLDASTGAWTAPSYSTNSISATGANTGPLVSNNVGAALTNLNTSVTNTAAVAVKYDDATTKDQVTFNPAGAAVKLTNVAAGTLNATSTDAVNGSQLFATNQIVNSINNGAGIKYFHANSTLADSSATGQDSVAIGPLASATLANGVALGSNSSATGTTLANAAYGVGGAATAGGEVNIANGANGRRITGLAAGSSATDAVNVSQLNKAGQDTATALGGGAALDTNTGAWTAPSYSTNSISATGANTGPLVSNNVGAALSNLNTSLTNTAEVAVKYDDASTKTQVTFNPAGAAVKLTNVAAGTLNASSTDAVNGSQLFATNQTVDNLVNNGAGIKYFHSNSTLADSSATGQDSVAIGPLASATVANGVALGSNSSATGTTLANAAYGVGGAATGGEVNIANGANGRRITGLAAGSSATDAVNVSQLNKTGQDTATALGGGATLDATTGTWTAPSYSINNISATGSNTGPLVSNNVGAALTSLNTSLTNTAAVAVKYDDAATKTQVTFNPAGTAVKLTNIAVGALNATSTDAVNGSQLFATNQTVDNLVNNGTGIKYFHSNSTLADSSATGQDSVAMGPTAVSGGANSVALGNGATASFDNSVALGSGSSATGATLANAAYGVGGAATGGEVNIANGADGRRITGLAAGFSATDAVNVSQLNKAGQDTAAALGGGAALDTNTGAWTAPSYSTNSISATGASTGPLVSNNVGAALSNLNTSLTNTAAVAVKYDDATTKTQVTFNPAGTAVKLTNVAAGTLNASSTDAVNGSQLFATNQTVDNLVNNGTGIKYFHSNSVLADSQATGLDSVAIGPQSIAAGAHSLAVGSGANVAADGSLALGHLSQAQVAGGIALGEGSVADRVLAPTTGSIPAGGGTVIYDTSDATLLGSVSVGKAGSYRQITNVADATEDHDAVTLRQLTGAMGSLSSTGTLYFHANSTNAVDSLASGAESIAVGPGTVVNGDNGIGLGNQASVGQAAAGGIAIGRNTQVLLASGIALGSAAQTAAEQSVALGAGANASHAMSVALGSSSLTRVGAETGYSAYRLAAPQTSVGEIGIGTALGNRKLTGLAAGSQDNDAVNVAQLKLVGDQVDQNTTDITHLGGRIGGLETLIGAGGGIKYLHVNSTKADSAATGTDAMALGAQAQASGNGSVAMGSGATAAADGSVAVGSGSSDDGRGAETYSGKYSGANNATSGTVSVGNATTGATRTVSNVADGKNANDAVNVRQLDGAVVEAKQYTDTSIANLGTNAAQQDGRITAVADDVSNIKNGTDGMFQVNNRSAAAKPKATGVDSIAGGAGAVASGNNSAAVGTRSQATGENSVALGNGAKASARNATALGANSVADRDSSVSVGSTGNERQITNLAAGTRDTDAVNLEQLTRSVADITESANAYTDQRYMELKNDLKQQDEILSAGIAGAMAMASLPQSYSPGSSMTTVAASTYRGQASLAFGVSHMSGNGRWVTKLQGSTDTQRKVGLAVGIGYQW
ncbi:YadA-like family protein [Pseudomonas chlororaphis]